jgi:hypothetical protein
MDADRNGVTPLTAVSETDGERQRRVDRAAERERDAHAACWCQADEPIPG